MMGPAATVFDPVLRPSGGDDAPGAWDREDGSRPSHSPVTVKRLRDGIASVETDEVAEEVPVALVYNGVPHVVMLATPLDLEDFAIGFSLTEGIVRSPSEILAVRAHNRSEGIEVRLRITEERFAGLPGKERNLTGRTGCGLCGSATLQQAVRHPAPVGAGAGVSMADLRHAQEELRARQDINLLTGAVHAAAWVVPGKGLVHLREDVGRHNALDKLIGVLAKTRAPRNEGFVLVTSRASYEMVQKCAEAGIGFLAAISAPTGLAVRLALETGLTLVGFVRGEACVVYAHPHRLHEQ
ncbi:formate dehydrogenase accessory sulfurtransferase FdhD [Methylococcus sp. Mc7]|uniref:formate dehydrogenase accessory sulfurtransferase FdhD n=1 Tax=Methylococcus sp. Mc7 TaxID=2860258 RepID=UPI001C52BBB2|nr:formate dehydrogenase accessory sulfurtransferase FdhD [Methylococcus sp. Mc7]QXP83939.1 formate dehydrogenase accessory sulfurtransferase FdhD [Methylococcus sp. Mc7]